MSKVTKTRENAEDGAILSIGWLFTRGWVGAVDGVQSGFL